MTLFEALAAIGGTINGLILLVAIVRAMNGRRDTLTLVLSAIGVLLAVFGLSV